MPCRPWSYHNGGSWPTLLWQVRAHPYLLQSLLSKVWCSNLCFWMQFTIACIKMGRPDLASKAVEIAEKRILKDRWPEYYDTKTARFIGKQARLYQTWSIAGYLAAKSFLANPEIACILACEEDLSLMEGCSCTISASPHRKCTRNAMQAQSCILV